MVCDGRQVVRGESHATFCSDPGGTCRCGRAYSRVCLVGGCLRRRREPRYVADRHFGCGHGIGGAGSFGAEHADVDITSAHLVAAGPDDPNFGTPGAQVFYIDSNVVNGEPNVSDFLGDSGIPAEAGHYSFHPAPGVAFVIQVAFRPAK